MLFDHGDGHAVADQEYCRRQPHQAAADHQHRGRRDVLSGNEATEPYTKLKYNSLEILSKYCNCYPEPVVSEAGGRRERKNAQTRATLADAALRLFLEKGYYAVSVREIADAVDVSVPTVFNHVPGGKEALIFDDGAERRESLLTAVRERDAGQSVLAALREFLSGRGPFVATPTAEFRRRTDLIMNTPALRGHSRKLWIAAKNRWPRRSPPKWAGRLMT